MKVLSGSSKNSQAGFAPVFLLISVFLLALVPVLTIPVTTKTADSPQVKGTLIARGDDNGGDNNRSDNQNRQSTSNSTTGNTGTVNSTVTVSNPESQKDALERQRGQQKQLQEQLREQAKQQLEIQKKMSKLPDSFELKEVDGELEINDENASESGRTATRSGHLEFESRIGSEEAKLKIEANENGLSLESGSISALSRFPLSYNQTTNQLTVNTPNGRRVIRVLPNQAAAIAATSGIISQLGNLNLGLSTTPNTSDNLSFRVEGVKTGTIFGIIPFSANVQTEVGAQSGSVLSVSQPLWLQLLAPFIKGS